MTDTSIPDTPTQCTPLKQQLQEYFNGVGFERWAAIYGEAPLSRVRRTIRAGHAEMLAQAGDWLRERYPQTAGHTPQTAGHTLLDAGCGTGLFSTAMAGCGFAVTAVDIAPRMVETARRRAEEAGVAGHIRFLKGDTEVVTQNLEPFDAVVCFDVLVHYPQESFVPLCTHLARLSNGPLLLTYAPYNRVLAAMHWVGGFFPRGQRRTEIQMIRSSVVADALAAAGMRIQRSADISRGFYHVRLIEADRL